MLHACSSRCDPIPTRAASCSRASSGIALACGATEGRARASEREREMACRVMRALLLSNTARNPLRWLLWRPFHRRSRAGACCPRNAARAGGRAISPSSSRYRAIPSCSSRYRAISPSSSLIGATVARPSAAGNRARLRTSSRPALARSSAPLYLGRAERRGEERRREEKRGEKRREDSRRWWSRVRAGPPRGGQRPFFEGDESDSERARGGKNNQANGEATTPLCFDVMARPSMSGKTTLQHHARSRPSLRAQLARRQTATTWSQHTDSTSQSPLGPLGGGHYDITAVRTGRPSECAARARSRASAPPRRARPRPQRARAAPAARPRRRPRRASRACARTAVAPHPPHVGHPSRGRAGGPLVAHAARARSRETRLALSTLSLVLSAHARASRASGRTVRLALCTLSSPLSVSPLSLVLSVRPRSRAAHALARRSHPQPKRSSRAACARAALTPLALAPLARSRARRSHLQPKHGGADGVARAARVDDGGERFKLRPHVRQTARRVVVVIIFER